MIQNDNSVDGSSKKYAACGSNVPNRRLRTLAELQLHEVGVIGPGQPGKIIWHPLMKGRPREMRKRRERRGKMRRWRCRRQVKKNMERHGRRRGRSRDKRERHRENG